MTRGPARQSTTPGHSMHGHPGEAGIGRDYPPPFRALDEATAWLFDLNRFGIRPGLERIEGLLGDLGHPERELRTLVIAGTNGKGSTTTIVAALLQAAGYRVATFTSPHLLQVYERIRVDGRPIAAERFARMVTAIRPSVQRHAASWFETLTALAVACAHEDEVDFLCCETGLGGRLDATNILPAVATLLTTVDLAHQHILGETRNEIAAEKLGLLKPDVPLFCGVDDDLRQQIFAAAVTAGAPCHFLNELSRIETDGANWNLHLRERTIADLPHLASPVLDRNAALALLSLAELEARDLLRLPADPAAALRQTFLPGRSQLVLERPDWIFDTAHNTQALCAALEAFLARPCRGRRLVLFGGMRDKEVAAPVGQALRACAEVIATPVSLPRSRNADELGELLAAHELRGEVAADPARALSGLARRLTAEDAVLVTGSGFLVAEVLYRLGFAAIDETRQPEPAAPRLQSWLEDEDGAPTTAGRGGGH